MKASEAGLLLEKLANLYHGRVKPTKEAAKNWAQVFRDDSDEDVNRALEAWMNRAGDGNFSNHPPSAVEIRTELRRIRKREEKQTYLSASSLEYREYLSASLRNGLVLARMRDSGGRLFVRWESVKDCVCWEDRHYRKIDFIAKWAPDVLVEECRLMFPGGCIAKVFELFEGAKENKPNSVAAVVRWAQMKEFMLEIATENAFKATGKRVVKSEDVDSERTERTPYREGQPEIRTLHRPGGEQPEQVG